jgi:hypothetical protein
MRFFPPSLTAAFLAGLCWALSAPGSLSAAQANAPQTGPASALAAGLPLFFEPNRPEAGGGFVARGGHYQFLIAPAEAFLVLRKTSGPMPTSPLERNQLTLPRKVETRAVRVRFLRGDPGARIAGEQKLPGQINYLVGNDPARWRTQLSTYSRVRVEQVYPGIDLLYYGNQDQLEYDFEISPRVDPATIALRFEGADKVSVNAEGELVLALGEDEIRQPRPVIYQIVGGVRRPVSGGYTLRDSRTVAFTLGSYDRELPLVIDPVLTYSSYFGGNLGDNILAIKLNPADNSVYVAGQILSTIFTFPLAPGFQPTFGGGELNGDAFVARLDATLTNLIYFTYLGGSGNDGGLDLALDAAGDAFLTGFTDSTNFPVANAIFPNIGGTFDTRFQAFPTDAFLAELNAAGSALVYSTYLGGSDAEVAGGVAVDPAGNAYVTGYTSSTNYPTTNALVFHLAGTTNNVLNRWAGNHDAFVTKVSPGGSSLVYSTYLGGTNNDEGQGIVADAAGFAYVTGYTTSTNFPVTNALAGGTLLNRSTNRPGQDGFLARIDPGGVILDSSTYFGGTNSDAGFRIVIDDAGALYVTGPTSSGDYPNTATNVAGLRNGTVGTNLSFNTDAFLTKFAYAGNTPSIVYSALFGGSINDTGWALALDGATNVYVIGITVSTNFPSWNTNGSLSGTRTGGSDLFVTAFNADASALLYSAYLGGSADDFGYGIAVDASGTAYIAGRTLSTNFPVVNALQGSREGLNDGIIARITQTSPTLTTFQQGSELFVRWRAFAPEFHVESTPQLVAPNWSFLAAAPPPTNGWHTVRIDTTNSGAFFRLKQ